MWAGLVCVGTCICTCLCVYMCVYMCVYVCVCVHVCVHLGLSCKAQFLGHKGKLCVSEAAKISSRVVSTCPLSPWVTSVLARTCYCQGLDAGPPDICVCQGLDSDCPNDLWHMYVPSVAPLEKSLFRAFVHFFFFNGIIHVCIPRVLLIKYKQSFSHKHI